MIGLARERLRHVGRHDFIAGASYIDGIWKDGMRRAELCDPATGEVIASVGQCDVSDMARAIDAADAAFGVWRTVLPAVRGDLLRGWAALIRENIEDLATIVTCEQGKPLAESRGEIMYAAGFVDWFAAEGERAYGETIPSHKVASQLSVRLQPVGIVAVVTPWNFPSAMITRKAAAALAAGCPVIVKPACETPLSALALARLAQQAGLPAGLFQVVCGAPAPLVGQLVDDTRVRALSFTGSTAIGRLLLEGAARTVKRVSMELGGHAPFIVFDDSDVDFAVRGGMAAKFATSGQDCLAANRIYVQRGVYDAFVTGMGRAVAALRVGHGLTEGTDIGPMTTRSVVEKCLGQIDDATRRGARLIVGDQAARPTPRFVMPTLLADVTDDMLIAREETFGPVAAILPFDTEDEVIARANRSESGLAAYVYTDGLRRATRVSDRLEYGMVGVNTASFTGSPIPFGGWKQSGLGREGSRHGLTEFLEPKYVCLGDLAA
ncbi:NAD-dependent succinate-semialdehyde dehydrogenase [Gluconacetobacter azotocaptans]|uniref:NAD-dependent succinate-semialdehyde dehydrogenase n=1 Tax=Gluconacetobacter azotocaptans TaxID=142834 RepID=A0A7W4PCP6_9PROT|nr:NAD-dependent succinate-semialdehyde dehydrogenase [Gluconacetobacter azotocaptans]MBB2188923.1 NAD-dependent succinate-semialdehyde dehydrogenase [Gluconacetobacter azotocaptans]GBQ26002.1 aldehyde/betaine dehydrogenase [Gluconacetobacter azotocaptans DSM 13594]